MNRTATECQPCDNFTPHETEPPGFFVTHDCPRCKGNGVRENCGNCNMDHHRGRLELLRARRKHAVLRASGVQGRDGQPRAHRHRPRAGEGSLTMGIVTNHWGWKPLGIWRWFRWGWAKPFATWGVEVSGSQPRRFARRVKVGPFCFGWGEYPS